MEITDKLILDNLYKKHSDLHAETIKVESAILAYNGTIPTYGNSTTATPVNLPDYPIDGTWKDKIFYVLAISGPSLVGDIINSIHKKEPDVSMDKLNLVVSQYCSTMGIAGILDREREGKTYRYSIRK